MVDLGESETGEDILLNFHRMVFKIPDNGACGSMAVDLAELLQIVDGGLLPCRVDVLVIFEFGKEVVPCLLLVDNRLFECFLLFLDVGELCRLEVRDFADKFLVLLTEVCKALIVRDEGDGLRFSAGGSRC